MTETAFDAWWQELHSFSSFWSYRIHWAFVGFCTGNKSAVFPEREQLYSWDRTRLARTWEQFLELPDKELLGYYNFGRVALRFLRSHTEALRTMLAVSDPEWDAWAETVPAAFRGH